MKSIMRSRTIDYVTSVLVHNSCSIINHIYCIFDALKILLRFVLMIPPPFTPSFYKVLYTLSFYLILITSSHISDTSVIFSHYIRQKKNLANKKNVPLLALLLYLLLLFFFGNEFSTSCRSVSVNSDKISSAMASYRSNNCCKTT